MSQKALKENLEVRMTEIKIRCMLNKIPKVEVASCENENTADLGKEDALTKEHRKVTGCFLCPSNRNRQASKDNSLILCDCRWHERERWRRISKCLIHYLSFQTDQTQQTEVDLEKSRKFTEIRELKIRLRLSR